MALVIDSQTSGWSYGEIVARDMRVIFESPSVSNQLKTLALGRAVRAAYYMNRFAAMDSCRSMVRQVLDQDLALHVATLFLTPEAEFLTTIEPYSCRHDAIRNAIHAAQNRSGA